MSRLSKNEIAGMMIDYAVKNWKAVCYESERAEAIAEYMNDADAIDGFIDGLTEDIEACPEDAEALNLLALVKTMRA